MTYWEDKRITMMNFMARILRIEWNFAGFTEAGQEWHARFKAPQPPDPTADMKEGEA